MGRGAQTKITVVLDGDDKGLEKMLTGAAKKAGATSVQVEKLAADTERATGRAGSALKGTLGTLAGSVLGEYSESLGQAGEAAEALGEKHHSVGTRVAETGAVVTAAGLALDQMASKDQAAEQQLDAAIEASGNATADYREEIERTVSAQERYGHTADDTQNALARLTEATQDPEKALEQMGVVADLAAAKHESLQSAADQVAKILGGRGGKILAAYGITMGDTGDKTKDSEEALKQLAERLNGQADAAVNTAAGTLHRYAAEAEDAGAKIAKVLGPALTVLGPALAGAGAAIDLYNARQAKLKAAAAEAAAAQEAAAAAQAAAAAEVVAAEEAKAAAVEAAAVAEGAAAEEAAAAVVAADARIVAANEAVAASSAEAGALSGLSKVPAILGGIAGPAGVAIAAVGLIGGGFLEAASDARKAEEDTRKYLAALSHVDQAGAGSFVQLNVAYDAQRQHIQDIIDAYDDWKDARSKLNQSGQISQDLLDPRFKNEGTDAAAASLRRLAAAVGDPKIDANGPLDKLVAGYDSLDSKALGASRSLDDLQKNNEATAATTAALAAQFHLTQDQVLALANANHIDLAGSLDVAQAAFSALNDAAKEQQSVAGQLAKDNDILASSFSSASEKADALHDKLQLLGGNAESVAKAQDDYTISLSKMRDELDKTTHSIDGNTAGAAANRNLFRGYLDQLANVAEAELKNGVAVDKVNQHYHDSYVALQKQAEQNGITAGSVDNLAKQYGKVPDQVKTTITADHAQADQAIAEVKRLLDGIPHSVKVGLTVAAQAAGSGSPLAVLAGLATGAVSLLPHKATGGEVRGPGTGTSDSIPTALSNGEFVVNAAAYARNRDVLHAINGGAVVGSGLPSAQPARASAGVVNNTYEVTINVDGQLDLNNRETQQRLGRIVLKEIRTIQQGGEDLGIKATTRKTGWF